MEGPRSQQTGDSGLEVVKIKREQFRVEIRKEKVRAMIDAKRKKPSSDDDKEKNSHYANLKNEEKDTMVEENAKRLRLVLKYWDESQVVEVLRTIRFIISAEEVSYIEPLRKTDLISDILDLLDEKYDKYPDVQQEASWLVINFASVASEDVVYLLELGCLNRLRRLLRTKNEKVLEHVLWALTNIIGEDSSYRDEIITDKYFMKLVYNMIENCEKLNLGLQKTICWLVSNICRGKPYPLRQDVYMFLPHVARLLLIVKDKTQFVDLMYALSYLISYTDDDVHSAIVLGMGPVVVNALNDTELDILMATIRAAGNLSAGRHDDVDELLAAGILTSVNRLLDHSRGAIRKEALWILSNICAGESSQIQLVLNTSILEKVNALLDKEGPDTQKEGILCLCNILYASTDEQIQHLIVKYNIIERLFYFLDTKKDYFAASILEGLDALLSKGESGQHDYNPYVRYIEEIQGTRVLEDLQRHGDEEIYNQVYELIDRYFETD